MGSFLQKRGYKIKVFNSIDFSKSMHYNPLAYIKNESDILKFVNALISNTKGEGKEGDPFWTKAETLLYCALLGYIIFEGAEEDRNMNTLVDMAHCNVDHVAMRDRFTALGAEMKMQVTVTRQEVFDAMHTI